MTAKMGSMSFKFFRNYNSHVKRLQEIYSKHPKDSLSNIGSEKSGIDHRTRRENKSFTSAVELRVQKDNFKLMRKIQDIQQGKYSSILPPPQAQKESILPKANRVLEMEKIQEENRTLAMRLAAM